VTQTVAPPAVTSSGSKSLPTRLAGVLFSPRATYADVAARPRVLGALTFVVLAGVVGVFLFMSTDVGQNAFVDQQVQQRESFGRPLNDAQYQQLERMAPYAGYVGAAFQLVSVPLLGAAIAGIALALFNAVLGGDATFKQVFAIVAHSGVVLTLSQLFGLPLAYARQTLSGATNLGVLMPFLDESSFAARLLGAIDLFIVWWIVSLAIGLGVLFRRRTGPIATTMLLVYVVIGVVIAAVKTAMSGA
jgi:Yip1-like protein